MSQTLAIVCHDCQKCLPCGKTLLRGGQVFKDPERIDLVEAFLLAHVGHALEFNDNDLFAYDDDLPTY